MSKRKSKAPKPRARKEATFQISEVTGLPVITGEHRPKSGEELTPERIKDILFEQEIEWALEAIRQK